MPQNRPFITGKTLDLNTMHMALTGASSETTCSLNDTDIRVYSGSIDPSGQIQKSFRYYQNTETLNFTITAGGQTTTVHGFDSYSATTIGSISLQFGGIDAIYNGWQVVQLLYAPSLSTEPVYFRLSDSGSSGSASASNDAWEQLVIGDLVLFREHASYGVQSDGDMLWIWNLDPANEPAQMSTTPFATTGNTTILIR